jgi:hypothetical protein
MNETRRVMLVTGAIFALAGFQAHTAIHAVGDERWFQAFMATGLAALGVLRAWTAGARRGQ